MSGHDTNPIFFNQKNKDCMSRTLANPPPLWTITSHFYLTSLRVDVICVSLLMFLYILAWSFPRCSKNILMVTCVTGFCLYEYVPGNWFSNFIYYWTYVCSRAMTLKGLFNDLDQWPYYFYISWINWILKYELKRSIQMENDTCLFSFLLRGKRRKK